MFQHFDHKIIRKLTAVFGTLFNNIQIVRYDADGKQTNTIIVPIRYAPKQKWYSSVFAANDDRLDNEAYSVKVPSMGFELGSLIYDTTRKLSKFNKVRDGNLSDNSLILGYLGAPYTVDFTLYVFADKTSDWTQIIEQIIPNFNPTLNVPVRIVHNEVNGQYVVQDVHITLVSVNPDQNMYGDFRTRGTYTWNLSFTMNVIFQGVMNEPGGIIGGADAGGQDPAILINFYNEMDGDMRLTADDIPVSILQLPDDV